MAAKTVVITGATSGIGEAAANRFAAKGERVVFIARDHARGAEMLKHLRAISGGGHKVHYADLSRLSEMKRVAAEIAQDEPRIDVLINNAGAMFNTRKVTLDGLEMTFALNHMAYFVITNLLLARMGAGGRIVSTASDAHKGAKLDFADLQSERHYSGFGVYGRSKLCNILFTRELARRLQGSGITANCFHPGFVATRFGDQSGGVLSFGIRAAKTFALTPEQGAQTMVYLASSPDVGETSGGYFVKCKPATPTPEAKNDADGRRLWEMSAELAGIGGSEVRAYRRSSGSSL
ncbi:MAG TPA: SDR family oxidoreductase [Rhizomicrobium sp.]|jgi:NAD(P)-dependent dehydrogenase (short-subunit alcohol dehydrogenase family)|nr:SDR family oxidoreductase [Rhizomicrobium sp.]